MNINKAETIRNPYALARWLAQKHGPRTKNGYKKYLPALLDEKNQQGNKANPGVSAKSIDMNKSEDIKKQKMSPGMAALAGWYVSGDLTRGLGQPTAAQQREFERQIQRAMRKKGRALRKESAMTKMQSFFNTKDSTDTYVRKTPPKNGVKADVINEILKAPMSLPPFAGARFDPTSHRWVKPENVGQTYAARGGKKRIRGTGTGVHERSVSGHGKGRIRGEGAGRKFKGETDLAAQRRKEGFTHGKLKRK
tara:strand:+ start:364 stop:1116 length:753 start_codon:yes stop_codon:yes gene_type:complete